MSIYITQGRYTQQAIKGMIANPEVRLAEVKALIERAPGVAKHLCAPDGTGRFSKSPLSPAS